jgi:hypothetical protein
MDYYKTAKIERSREWTEVGYVYIVIVDVSDQDCHDWGTIFCTVAEFTVYVQKFWRCGLVMNAIFW